jgi:DNA repair protein RecN (Recombination protein N)
VQAYAAAATEELGRISRRDERIGELRAEEARQLSELGRLASALSLRRLEAAAALSRDVEAELRDLKMDGARFGVRFTWREDALGVRSADHVAGGSAVVTTAGVVGTRGVDASGSPGSPVAFDTSGIDRIEFVVATNRGEPMKPVARVASGGETSRLMLGLKSVLSHADQTPTLVFDEIDQGIGGRVGATVGEKLWRLASAGGDPAGHRQVLCVTHLPQLAGFGDVHLRVAKHVVGSRTVTRVELLDEPERVEETQQMLGARGAAARQGAVDMLAHIAKRKRSLLAPATAGS